MPALAVGLAVGLGVGLAADGPQRSRYVYSLVPTYWRQSPLSQRHRDTYSLLEDLFNRSNPAPLDTDTSQVFRPSLDVSETEEAVLVLAELPGVSAENIEVEFHGDTLVLSGDKHREQQEGDHWLESQHGRFRRSLKIAIPVNAKEIEARLADGLLTIRLPKAEAARSHKIEIQA